MTIELEILVLAGAVIGLVCGFIGYWWATTNQRKAAGGKSVSELTAEKAQYEAEVVEHFKASADLLNEMTGKYRDVYRHMAEGAQKLVPGENVAPALAALQSGLLAAPEEPAREAVLESEDADAEPAEATTPTDETASENEVQDAAAESNVSDALASDEPQKPRMDESTEDDSNDNAVLSPPEEVDETTSRGGPQEAFFSDKPNVGNAETNPQSAGAEEGKSSSKTH